MMQTNFESFKTIKDVMEKNKKSIHQKNELFFVYSGFCEHLLSYMDAYETLFNQKNYYACKALDRILLDLYIKTRLLKEVDNPNNLAAWILNGEKIKDYNFPSINGTLTDIKLCKYFDQEDNNYSFWPGTKDKISENGWWENRYREGCQFIHPDKKSALEYFKKEECADNEKTRDEFINQDKGWDFVILAGKTFGNLSELIHIINKTLETNEHETI